MTSTHVSADVAALVRAAQGGNRAALGDVIAVVRPAVYGYVLSRVCDRAIADDVTQEVAMTVVTALPRYEDTGRSVLAWAIGIAANKVNESRRARRRHDEIPVDDLPEGTLRRWAGVGLSRPRGHPRGGRIALHPARAAG